MTVVDIKRSLAKNGKFAIFIVPQGIVLAKAASQEKVGCWLWACYTVLRGLEILKKKRRG